MRKFTSETIILTKEAWVLIKNWERVSHGYKKLSDTFIDRVWSQCFRNGGANPATHPISDNEIRVDRESFSISLEEVKAELEKAGYGYRQDGFIVEGFNF